MSRLNWILVLAAALVLALPSEGGAQVPPPNGGATFTITTGGVSTTYVIDSASMWEIFWKASQATQNAQVTQNRQQYAKMGCLVPTSAAVDGLTVFDWTTDKIWDKDGAYYSVASSTNVPYRNAQRMGTVTTVQKLCQYGGEIFAKGKIDSKWYVWRGGSWVVLATNLIDTTILN